MKKFLSCLLSVLLIASLAACGRADETEQPNPEASPSASESDAAAAPEPVTDEDPRLDLIVVDQKVDEMLSQSIVTIRNNSDSIFDGMIHVRFTTADGTSVGSDTIFVEQLSPGRDTYARIDLDATEGVRGAYEFGVYSFEEMADSADPVLDEDLSAQLAAAFEGSFGGAGNPEYATSWYKYLTGVSVYTASAGNRAVVTVTPGDQDGIEMICKSLFWNYGDEYGLMSVEAVTEDNESLFLFSA